MSAAAANSKKRKAEEEEDEEEAEEPESWTADVMMQKAWLMRVPNDLAAKWHQAEAKWREYHEAAAKAGENEKNMALKERAMRLKKEAELMGDLGTVSIEQKGGTSVGKFQTPGDEAAGRKPETFKMTLDNDSSRKEQSQHLKIFSETFLMNEEGESDKRLRVNAEITDYWSIQEDAKAWAERHSVAKKKTISDIFLDEDEDDAGEMRHDLSMPMQQRDLDARKHQKLQEQAEKQTALMGVGPRPDRQDRTTVENTLFNCFMEAELWSIKDLKEKTNMAESNLREGLKAIGDPIDSGPNRGKWQLKASLGGGSSLGAGGGGATGGQE